MTKCIRCDKEDYFVDRSWVGLCPMCEFDDAVMNDTYDGLRMSEDRDIEALEDFEEEDNIRWDEWNQMDEDQDLLNRYRGE
jgi:hypothetical protein